MNILMVTSKVKEENVADAQAAVDKLFQSLEQAQPAGVRYAVTRLSEASQLSPSWSSSPVRSIPCARFPRTRSSGKTSNRGGRGRRLWST